MRTAALVALTLISLTASASAQMMCGPAQGQQAQSPSGMMGGMCGMGQAATDDPMNEKKAEKPKASGMCPCRRNMAMMRGGMGMDHMPGMGAPKQ